MNCASSKKAKKAKQNKVAPPDAKVAMSDSESTAEENNVMLHNKDEAEDVSCHIHIEGVVVDESQDDVEDHKHVSPSVSFNIGQDDVEVDSEDDSEVDKDVSLGGNAEKLPLKEEVCQIPFTRFVDCGLINTVLNDFEDDSELNDMEIGQDLFMQYIKQAEHSGLKKVLRSGTWKADHDIRQLLWKLVCKHLHKADETDIYEDFATDLFQGDSFIRTPSFVDTEHVYTYHLNTAGVTCAKKILCVLEHCNPDIVYSPLLFSLVSIFLHYMDVNDCYNCVYSLLRSNGFITQTKVSYEASKLVIKDLAKKYAKSGYVLLVRHCSNIDTVFDSWIWWIFYDLPFPYLVRILDCYLQEGVKVFYRITLAILILFSKAHSKKSGKAHLDSSTISQTLRQFCKEIPVKVDKLLKIGFGIRGLTRKEIHRLHVKNEMYITSIKRVASHQDMHGNHGNNILPMSRSFSGPLVLQKLESNMLNVEQPLGGDRSRSRSTEALPVHVPPCIGNSYLLDRSHLFAIWTWLPTRYAVCQPELLYTSEEHGTSLVTLYQRVENHQPTVIVIKNLDNEIFGAFCSASWKERRQSTKNLSYFGTGETFLFTLTPEKKKFEWVGLTGETVPNTANMFQAGDRSILTIGGGHGEGIFLDENLLHCRTEKCDTFNNEPLCHEEDFQCKVVEVYGFQ